MVIEHAIVELVPGKEEAFLDFVESQRPLLEGRNGCQSISCGRGVENPSKAVLILRWDSVEAHVAARGVDAFATFAAGLGSFLTSGAMEHFSMRSWPA